MKLYKHVNNTDVAIQIIREFRVKETGIIKMKIMWWNIGDCHKPYPMLINQKIQVHFTDWVRNWKVYANV